MLDSEDSSHELMEQVAEIVNGASDYDIMLVFSWILGDVIVQTKADSEKVLEEFKIMVGSATEMLGRRKPRGVTLN